MKIDLPGALRRVHPFVALVTCVGVLLAYLTGVYVTGPFHENSRWLGAMLACTSTVVVLQVQGFRESLRSGWLRVLGTAIGALIAYVYLRFFPFSVAGMLVSVFVLELVSMLLRIYNDGRIATITLIVILLISQSPPRISPAVNCLLRFVESAVGVGVGVGLVWVLERWERWRIGRHRTDR